MNPQYTLRTTIFHLCFVAQANSPELLSPRRSREHFWLLQRKIDVSVFSGPVQVLQSFVQSRYSTDAGFSSGRCCGRETPRILLVLNLVARHSNETCRCVYIYIYFVYLFISAAQRAMPNCQAPGHTYDLFTHRFDDCAAGWGRSGSHNPFTGIRRNNGCFF